MSRDNPIGKQDVRADVWFNGVFAYSRVEHRQVYQRRDGRYEVNHLNGRKIVVKQADGTFYFREDVKMIPARGFTSLPK